MAKRTPVEVREPVGKVEAEARERVAKLRDTVAADGEGRRDVFGYLFREGLSFSETVDEVTGRTVFAASGKVRLGGCLNSASPGTRSQ